MTRKTLMTIMLLSSIAAPVVVGATGTSPGPAADLPEATAPMAVQADVTPAPAPVCSRRIKVIYSGYGEGRNVPCAMPAAEARR